MVLEKLVPLEPSKAYLASVIFTPFMNILMVSPQGSKVRAFKLAKLALVFVFWMNVLVVVKQALLGFALEVTLVTTERC